MRRSGSIRAYERLIEAGMNVLIIGSGGREHALALALRKSPRLDRLFIAPGSAGAAEVAEQIALDAGDHRKLADFCRENAIGLVVVGPEAPLVAGLADELAAAGIACFGPSRAAAQLEGSKGFAKDFCRDFSVPTAAYRRFHALEPALAYLRAQGAPIVVKADGLAAGKGVVVAATLDAAEAAVTSMFGGAFGAAGAEVVIEDVLEGEEVSFFALSDGERAVAFGSAQDHKRVGDGDTGPNTGGMGAYSPAPIMTEAMAARVMREIVEPTIAGLRARGAPFRGVLFAGLMIGANGPKLIEYNVRFGDPEAEVLLARFEGDLLELILSCAEGKLPETPPRFSDQAALTVVLAAKGYPGAPLKGAEIRGLDRAAALSGVTIHHAGTRRVGDRIVADGGRVLAVTALGPSVGEAQRRAYAAIDLIDWPEGFCRHDIGWRAVARERAAARSAMSASRDFFPGFAARSIAAPAGAIFARIGGSGPPLLLLHGFPQTHVEWRLIAPRLAEKFTLVLMDLRGYGGSSAPPSENGEAYAKREMAKDAIAVMAALGFERFSVIGHDRGGRVAYRLALDAPERVERLAVVDIIPTAEMWRSMDAARAMQTYHWLFLAQPAPMPETLIRGASIAWLEHTLASWTGDKSLAAFRDALDAYCAAFDQDDRIHAFCEDYRAGATIDRRLDEEDRAAGRRIVAPLLALWGAKGIPSEGDNPLAIWRRWAISAKGRAIKGGHFLPEENPEETATALLDFLAPSR
jgi:phosphoribosylamine--glycine ligase